MINRKPLKNGATLFHSRNPEKEILNKSMRKFYVFLFRTVLAAVFAIIVSRIFFQDASFIKVTGLGAALLSFSYLFEYIRKKDQ